MKYTKEQEIELKVYEECTSFEERSNFIVDFCAKHDKNTRSIIAKLSKLGIYKVEPKVSKVTGEAARTKIQMVEELCKKWQVDKLEGFEKTPKLTLLKILKSADDITELKAEIKRLEMYT